MSLGGVLRERIDGLVRFEPRPGVTYAEVLGVDDPQRARWRAVAVGVGGAMTAVVILYVLPSLVSLGVLALFWLAGGSSEVFAPWAGQMLRTFAEPSGMVAAHLGLASLIPVSLGLVLFLHQVHPRWLHSVQPGFRWRFALVTGLAAFVVIGGLWALSRIGQSWTVSPEPAFWGFVGAILLTAPLQAAAEEYVFRGYILQALNMAAPNGPWFGIVGSAAVFALMHGTQDLPAFLYRFVFGVLAGWLAVRTGGLEAGIAAHVANNVIAFGWAALSGTVTLARTTTTTTWAELGWAMAGFVGFALVALWIARRMRVATRTPGARFGGADEV